MRLRFILSLAVAVAMTESYAGAQTELPFKINVLENSEFEADGAANDTLTIVPPPGWIVTGSATQAGYGVSAVLPERGLGEHFLAGGPLDSVSTATQQFVVTDPLSALYIDSWYINFEFTALLGGNSSEGDHSIAEVQFADSAGVTIRAVSVGPVTAMDRSNQTVMLPVDTYGMVPPGTRRIVCTVTMTRLDGVYNNAYCDALSLVVFVSTAVEASSWSKVKELFKVER